MLCKALGSVGKCPSVWEISGNQSIHTFRGLTCGDLCWLLVEAMVGVRVAVEVAEEASPVSSSVSVSVRSRDGLILGAPSKKPKGSTQVSFPKNVVRRVNNSLQLDPARAIVICCRASARKAAAFVSSSVASLKSCKDCKGI